MFEFKLQALYITRRNFNLLETVDTKLVTNLDTNQNLVSVNNYQIYTLLYCYQANDP